MEHFGIKLERIQYRANQLLAIVSIVILAACTSSQDDSPQSGLSYSAVGQLLNADYTVNNLYVGFDKVYLTLADDEDSTFGYAMISGEADANARYELAYLTLPDTPQYIIIGDMVIDESTAQLYVPVARINGAFYNYTWLQYESGATVPNASPIGSYSVAAGLANQFALTSASFYHGSIYADYAGHLIGFNTSNGQVRLRKDDFLVSALDGFVILDKNNVVAINGDGNSVVVKDPESNAQRQIGESFTVLEDRGLEVSPHFAVHDGIVYILAIQRSVATDLAHLALCTTSLQSNAEQWSCKVSDTSLSQGSQIINLDTHAGTGAVYFVLQSLAQGTQLYRINPSIR